MMEQMDGRMEVNADDLTYCIVLYFPEKKSIINFKSIEKSVGIDACSGRQS